MPVGAMLLEEEVNYLLHHKQRQTLRALKGVSEDWKTPDDSFYFILIDLFRQNDAHFSANTPH